MSHGIILSPLALYLHFTEDDTPIAPRETDMDISDCEALAPVLVPVAARDN